MKRALKLDGTDIELVISKAVLVKVPRPFMYLWELDDGTWRLEYSSTFISTFAALKRFEFNKEEEPPEDSKKKVKKQYPASISLVTKEEYAASEDEVKSLLLLNRVTGIAGHRGSRFIHLESREDEWYLLYWKSVIPDINLVTSITIVRED
jgi:hypothetical protein